MKVYIAARYARRAEMEKVADQLIAAGFEITSDWVYGSEEGMALGDVAIKDVADVERSDAILEFTERKGFMFHGGGRHVEFGVAAGLGRYLYFIGDRETVFHHLPWAQQFESVEDFIAQKKGREPMWALPEGERYGA